MIIVSNEKVPNEQITYSYDEFVDLAFSDEGLDTNGEDVFINANDIDQEVFAATSETEDIKYFTLDGTAPDYVVDADVYIEDWSEDSENSEEYEENSEGYSENNVEGQEISNSEYINSSYEEQGFNNDIANLIDEVSYDYESEKATDNGEKDAKIYVFGSSKGGTGKTFTSIISTYRYAKTHPDQKIALVDFDIIDGQVGISIHKIKPKLDKYFTEYQKGYRDFRTMKECAVKANDPYPQNVDFYLAPSQGAAITDYNFWLNVLENARKNYDVVVFDTGIDYINLPPISFAYKCADKVLLVTTTSVKSVNSVKRQIGRLIGEIPSPDQYDGKDVYSKEDDIGSRLNVIITQMVPTNEMNGTIYRSLSEKANVIATFGVITDSISECEYYGRWDVFDNHEAIMKTLDKIME